MSDLGDLNKIVGHISGVEGVFDSADAANACVIERLPEIFLDEERLSKFYNWLKEGHLEKSRTAISEVFVIGESQDFLNEIGIDGILNNSVLNGEMDYKLANQKPITISTSQLFRLTENIGSILSSSESLIRGILVKDAQSVYVVTFAMLNGFWKVIELKKR